MNNSQEPLGRIFITQYAAGGWGLPVPFGTELACPPQISGGDPSHAKSPKK